MAVSTILTSLTCKRMHVPAAAPHQPLLAMTAPTTPGPTPTPSLQMFPAPPHSPANSHTSLATSPLQRSRLPLFHQLMQSSPSSPLLLHSSAPLPPAPTSLPPLAQHHRCGTHAGCVHGQETSIHLGTCPTPRLQAHSLPK